MTRASSDICKQMKCSRWKNFTNFKFRLTIVGRSRICSLTIYRLLMLTRARSSQRQNKNLMKKPLLQKYPVKNLILASVKSITTLMIVATLLLSMASDGSCAAAIDEPAIPEYLLRFSLSVLPYYPSSACTPTDDCSTYATVSKAATANPISCRKTKIAASSTETGPIGSDTVGVHCWLHWLR